MDASVPAMTEVYEIMIKTIHIFPGVTLRCCREDRFKQGVLSLQFLRPMCREEAALNALLPAVLLRGRRVDVPA